MVAAGQDHSMAATEEEEEEEEEEILHAEHYNVSDAYRGFPGTRVFDAQASPHFDVVEVRPRNYYVPASL